MSKEHVIPEWVRPYVADAPAAGTHRHLTLLPDETKDVRWEGEPATTSVRCVCERCNNTWMSDLENAAKQHMIPMIQGHRHVGGLPILTRWAVKTSLIAGCRFRPSIPIRLYRDFYAKRKPGPGTRVHLGAVNPPGMHYIDHRPLEVVFTDNDPPETYRGYASTLAIGHLCFYVLSTEESEGTAEDFQGKFTRAFELIWPITGPVDWPPPVVLDGVPDLDAVANIVPTPWAPHGVHTPRLSTRKG